MKMHIKCVHNGREYDYSKGGRKGQDSGNPGPAFEERKIPEGDPHEPNLISVTMKVNPPHSKIFKRSQNPTEVLIKLSTEADIGSCGSIPALEPMNYRNMSC